MRIVGKLLFLLGFFVLAAIIAFAYAVPGSLPSQEVLRPILSVCILLAVGYAVRDINIAAFTKSHTTATGCG